MGARKGRPNVVCNWAGVIHEQTSGDGGVPLAAAAWTARATIGIETMRRVEAAANPLGRM
jgi:hypothetical protein